MARLDLRNERCSVKRLQCFEVFHLEKSYRWLIQSPSMQESFVVTRRGIYRDRQQSVPIVEMHTSCFLCPISVIVLNDAKRINPEILEAKFSGDRDSILKRPRKFPKIYRLFPRHKVSRRCCELVM